ncbi:MATE family efflux transporter [Campylobacter pinnipediorum subsp. pinnipediorum]|uniref:MATE family efflux transporter n=1 Tax=Campylobacter pinnipediorum TaxID=1965231 RepID=UPI0009949742|nr:MATE family efflux transporter [Campylobacter pinnipediorum]OPA77106.1 MATE family efflux transporter [Campylobacter pinnipediorum subsp. pinnipediorum]
MELSLKKLAIPIFFDIFLHFITLVINTYMVSKVSMDLVGSMGAGNQVMDFFMAIFSFLSVGCSIVVAQAIGAKKLKLAREIVHTTISFNTILGIFFACFVYFFGFEILDILNIPDELRNESHTYLHMLGIALCFDGIGMTLASILRVYNRAFLVMFVSFIMNIITLALNAIVLFGLIDGFDYGLYGVAVSTIIGRFVGVLLLIFILYKIAKIRVYISRLFVLSFDKLKMILKIGLPSAGEHLLWLGQYMVAFSFVASMGSNELSVQTIFMQLTLLLLLCGASISMANEVIVGRLIGSREFDRAYTHTFKSLKIGILFTIIAVMIVFILKDKIMFEFGLSDELKSIMLPLFFLSIVLEVGRTFNIVIVNALRATGDANFPFITGFIFMWCVSLPLGYFLGIYLKFGIIGVWLGFLADEWLRGIVNTLHFRSRKWQSKRLV